MSKGKAVVYEEGERRLLSQFPPAPAGWDRIPEGMDRPPFYTPAYGRPSRWQVIVRSTDSGQTWGLWRGTPHAPSVVVPGFDTPEAAIAAAEVIYG